MRVPLFAVSLVFLLMVGCNQISGDSEDGTTDSAGRAVTPTSQPESLSEAEIADRVWLSLELNTSSRDRSNWEVDEIRQVMGEDVAAEFEGEPAPGCWKGPTPVPNSAVIESGVYWYVRMMPKRATPVPQQRTISPTEPPAVPEPFLYQALFLLDIESGQIVARKLHCVIY